MHDLTREIGELNMCFCTPELRTPYCGKPECRSPGAHYGTITADEFMEASGAKTLDMSQMDALVRKSQEEYAAYEAQKKIASELLKKYEETEAAIMSALRDAGKTKYHVDGVGTIYIITKSTVTVPGNPESKKKFFQYLRGKGEDVLWSLVTVNSQTLNSWFRKEEELAEGRGEVGFQIPGINGKQIRETVGFRAAKKGN